MAAIACQVHQWNASSFDQTVLEHQRQFDHNWFEQIKQCANLSPKYNHW
jgi:hypothetical protein